MDKIKDKLSRKQYISNMVLIAALIMLITAGGIIYAVNASAASRVVVADSVDIGGKIYSKDNPMVIVELVPDKSVGTWGYLSGLNNGAVAWEDVAALPAGTEEEKQAKKQVCDTWISNYCRYIFYNGGNAYYEGWTEYRNRTADGKYTDWKAYSYVDGSKTSADIKAGAQLRFKFKNPVTGKIEYLDTYNKELVDGNGNVINNSDNILAYTLFGSKDYSDAPSDYYMSDKLRVVTVTPSELNADKSLVEEADAIVLSSGEKVNYISANTYKTMYDYAQKSNNKTLMDKYKPAAGVTDKSWDMSACNKFNDNNCYFGMDLLPEVAGRIYSRFQQLELSVIGDAGIYNASNKRQLPNLYKLFILLTCIDRDTCYHDLCETALTGIDGSITGVYQGEYGRLDLNSLTMYIRHTASDGSDIYDEVPEEDWYIENFSVFAKYLGSWPATNGYSREFPYAMYNGGLYRINDNMLIWGTGDSLFSQGFMSNYVDSSDKNNSNYYNVNNKFEDTEQLYSVDGKVAAAKMIQYVFGGYRTLPVADKLNVLEIQPSSDYKYDTYADGIENITKYFKKLRFKTTYINEKNYKRYINVTSVTVSELNGMTDSIANKYDLVIVDDNNTKNILNVKGTININNNGTESTVTSYYYSQGAVTDIWNHNNGQNGNNREDTGKDTVTSGNDITDKTYTKLQEYIDMNKPVILTSDIYYAVDEKVLMTGADGNTDREVETNIYKLKQYIDSKAQDKGYRANVVCELNEQQEFEKLSEEDKLTYKYVPCIEDVSVVGISETDNTFTLKFKTDNKNAAYKAELYIDKDANGVFVNAHDDTGELFAGGFNSNTEYSYGEDGYITITTTQLPEEMRAYLPWKLIIKDSEGLTAEYMGTLQLNNIAKKDVKVLQIKPVKSNTLALDNDDFLKAFNNVTNITGLALEKNDVTIVSVDDFCNSDRWYKNSRYESETSIGTDEDLLKDYTIVVLGFEDEFSNITNTHALANLNDYINSGKAVLMTHDTVGMASYSDETMDAASLGQAVNMKTDSYDDGKDNSLFYGASGAEYARYASYDWGYYPDAKDNKAAVYQHGYMFTTAFRNIIGMDMYHVSVGQKKKDSNGNVTGYQQGYTNNFLTRYAKLKDSSNNMIYNFKTNGKEDTEQTVSPITTKTVNKLNNGQITSYPYQIPDTLKVASTHGQYFQLDLEKQDTAADSIDSGDDVVVWYTLGENSTASDTPAEVKENKPKAGLELNEYNKYWSGGSAWYINNGKGAETSIETSIEARNQPKNRYGRIPGKSDNNDYLIPTSGAYAKLSYTSDNEEAKGKVSVTLTKKFTGDDNQDRQLKDNAYAYIVYKHGDTIVQKREKILLNEYKTITMDNIPANSDIYIYLGAEKENRSISSVASIQNIELSTDSEKNNYVYSWNGKEGSFDWEYSKLFNYNDGYEKKYQYLYPEKVTISEKGSKEQGDRSQYFSSTGRDAANNYYIYSKGNITYSGAGHSVIEDQGELELFVNTIVWAINSGNNPPEVKVDNAVYAGDNLYEQYAREGIIPDLTFVSFDKDMGSDRSALMSSGILYWDKNCNKRYDKDEDVVIQSFDKSVNGYNIYNLVGMTFTSPVYESGTNKLTAKAGFSYINGVVQSGSIELSDAATAVYNNMNSKLITQGYVYIGLKVADSKGGEGNATVKVVRRDLFKLD